jgi:hypothetical protein
MIHDAGEAGIRIVDRLVEIQAVLRVHAEVRLLLHLRTTLR